MAEGIKSNYEQIAQPRGLSINSKFKYGLWGPRLLQYDTAERSYTYLSFNLERHISYCVQSAHLLRTMWDHPRTALKVEQQKKYDKMYDGLLEAARREYDQYLSLSAQSFPYQADPTPSQELCTAIRGAARHLKYLTDKTGYGSPQRKSYDSDENSDRNVLA